MREEIIERLGAAQVEIPVTAEWIENTPAEPEERWAAAAHVAIVAFMLLIPLLGLAILAIVEKTRSGASPPSAVVARSPTSASTVMTVFVAPPPAVVTAPSPALWTSPRLNQLDVRPHWRASAIGVADAALLRDLENSVSQLSIGKATRDSDAIFVGAIDHTEWVALGRSLKRDGIVWLIAPNRSAAAAAAAFTTAAGSAGFAPVKRLRYSVAYSATQFVRRRRRRTADRRTSTAAVERQPACGTIASRLP